MFNLTTRRFNNVLKKIDHNNDFDFETFEEGMFEEKIIEDNNNLNNIIDFLVFDMDICSDSELYNLSQDRMKKIYEGIKKNS